jgi:hypothetical protein
MKRPINLASRTVTSLAFGVALATSMASTASAALLHEQVAVLDNAFPAYPAGPGQLADNFRLGSTAQLEKVTWWGAYVGAIDPDDFLLRVYSDLSGTGTVLAEVSAGAAMRSATASNLFGFDVYQYEFSLATAISLGAATPYYLFVQNRGGPDWFWLTGAAGDNEFSSRFEDIDAWESSLLVLGQSGAADLAFRLDGTFSAQTPEPGTLALLTLATAGLPFSLRRRKLKG